MEDINHNIPSSPDWNKERLDTMKRLFPDLFTDEGKINTDEWAKIIDPLSIHAERYEFRWFGKNKAKRAAFTPSTATLVFDAARSVNPSDTQNIIVEGENLEVLKLLSSSYREKIKCIYIDPPYNTGKDFVYSDKFAQDKKAYWEDAGIVENGVKVDTNAETDGRYHSNWLNMMFSRLLIARQLLREDGVIFVSIDDNEVHNLRKLCDEVFGEENFVSEIVWHSKYTTANDAKYVSRQHEYIIMYAKNKDDFNIGLLDRTSKMDAAYTNPDNDARGVWKPTPLHAKSGTTTYTIEFNNGIIWSPPKGRFPLYAKEELLRLFDDNRLYFGKDGKGSPNEKSFLTEVKQGKTVGSLWSYEHVGSSHQANEELATLIDKGIFDNPKTSKLIKQCIKVANAKEGIVLDFFGGSGTTGQAVMELNEEDGGNRAFILVQIPEATPENSGVYKAGFKKISDITIERNKRAIERLIVSNQSLNGRGFKVFKLTKSKFPNLEFAPNPDKTDEENIASLKQYLADKAAQLFVPSDRDELMTEILLKKGFSLNYSLEQQDSFKENTVFLAKDAEKELLICLDTPLSTATVEYFKTNTNQKFLCLERALDTIKKRQLQHSLGNGFVAF